MQGAVKIFMWTPLNQCQLDVQGEGGGSARRVHPSALEWGIMTKSKLFRCNEEEAAKADRFHLHTVEPG